MNGIQEVSGSITRILNGGACLGAAEPRRGKGEDEEVDLGAWLPAYLHKKAHLAVCLFVLARDIKARNDARRVRGSELDSRRVRTVI